MKVTKETKEYRKLIKAGILPRIFPARELVIKKLNKKCSLCTEYRYREIKTS